jgi:hypothetical protein
VGYPYWALLFRTGGSPRNRAGEQVRKPKGRLVSQVRMREESSTSLVSWGLLLLPMMKGCVRVQYWHDGIQNATLSPLAVSVCHTLDLNLQNEHRTSTTPPTMSYDGGMSA